MKYLCPIYILDSGTGGKTTSFGSCSGDRQTQRVRRVPPEVAPLINLSHWEAWFTYSKATNVLLYELYIWINLLSLNLFVCMTITKHKIITATASQPRQTSRGEFGPKLRTNQNTQNIYFMEQWRSLLKLSSKSFFLMAHYRPNTFPRHCFFLLFFKFDFYFHTSCFTAASDLPPSRPTESPQSCVWHPSISHTPKCKTRIVIFKASNFEQKGTAREK